MKLKILSKLITLNIIAFFIFLTMSIDISHAQTNSNIPLVKSLEDLRGVQIAAGSLSAPVEYTKDAVTPSKTYPATGYGLTEVSLGEEFCYKDDNCFFVVDFGFDTVFNLPFVKIIKPLGYEIEHSYKDGSKLLTKPGKLIKLFTESKYDESGHRTVSGLFGILGLTRVKSIDEKNKKIVVSVQNNFDGIGGPSIKINETTDINRNIKFGDSLKLSYSASGDYFEYCYVSSTFGETKFNKKMNITKKQDGTYYSELYLPKVFSYNSSIVSAGCIYKDAVTSEDKELGRVFVVNVDTVNKKPTCTIITPPFADTIKDITYSGKYIGVQTNYANNMYLTKDFTPIIENDVEYLHIPEVLKDKKISFYVKNKNGIGSCVYNKNSKKVMSKDAITNLSDYLFKKRELYKLKSHNRIYNGESITEKNFKNFFTLSSADSFYPLYNLDDFYFTKYDDCDDYYLGVLLPMIVKYDSTLGAVKNISDNKCKSTKLDQWAKLPIVNTSKNFNLYNGEYDYSVGLLPNL